MNPTKHLRLQASAVRLAKGPAPSNLFGPILASLVKSLSVHPPLLTSTDSEKLLNIAKTSFRENLASAHPADDLHTPNAHIASILKTPLFAPGMLRQTSEAALHKYLSDPIGHLEDHVALGTSTHTLAVACMRRLIFNRGAVPGGNFALRAMLALNQADYPLLNQTKALLIAILTREGRDDRVMAVFRASQYSHDVVDAALPEIASVAGNDRAAEIFLRLCHFNRAVLSRKSRLFGLKLLMRTKSKYIKKEMADSSLDWAPTIFDGCMIQLRYKKCIGPGIQYLKHTVYFAEKNSLILRSLEDKNKDIKLAAELWKVAMEQGRTRDADSITLLVYRQYRQLLGEHRLFGENYWKFIIHSWNLMGGNFKSEYNGLKATELTPLSE